MISIPPECYRPKGHRGKILVCEENGRRMAFHKSDGRLADKIRVDGCVLKGVLSCDYLVIDWKGRMHFVELKGSNVEHALAQIEATIPHFLQAPEDGQVWCFVVCSAVPPAAAPGIQAAKLRLNKKWKARTIIRTARCEHTLGE
jgi:hypothetical protein